MATLINLDYVLKDYAGKKITYSDYFSIDLQDIPDISFTFKEAENFFVKFSSTESIKVEIESVEDGKMVPIQLNKYYNLSKGIAGDESYYAGYFRINYIYNKQHYESSFMVEPNNATLDAIENLRDYVNYYYNGLSTDLNKKIENYNRNNRKGKNSSNIYENIEFFIHSFPETLSLIHAYGKHPYTRVTKEYQIGKSIKRIDSHSIQWMMSKGLAYNQDIYHPDTIYSSHTKMDLQTEENQYFKYLLVFFSDELKKAIIQIDHYQSMLEKKYNKDVSELELIKDQHQHIVKDIEVPENIKNNLAGMIARGKKDLANTKEKINEYASYSEILRKQLNTIQYYLEKMKGVKITRGIYHHHMHDHKVQSIDEHRKAYLMNMLLHQNEEKSFGYKEKSTPKLYETYIYIMLINMLTKIGYIPLMHESNADMIYALSNAGKFTLVKDGLYCDIYYDTQLKKSSSAFQENEYCYLNSYHNCPDFLLSFYEKGKIPYASIVVEAKWRNKKYIYNDYSDTKVMMHLRDYFNLVYYDVENHKRIRGIIDKVFVIYPDLDEVVVNIEEEDIQAVSIYPINTIESSKNYTYLFDEINYYSQQKNI